MKKYFNLALIILALIITVVCTIGVVNAFNFDESNSNLIKVKVTKITSVDRQDFNNQDSNVYFETIKFNAKYLSGGAVDNKDEELKCFQTISSTDATAPKKISVGDVVYIERNTTNVSLTANYAFKDFSRSTALLVLFIIFLVASVGVCLFSKFKTIAMFILSIIIGTELLLIAFANNKAVFLLSLLSFLIIILLNTVSQFGFSLKTVLSAVSSLVTLLVTTLVYLIIYANMNFTGIFNSYAASITEGQMKNGMAFSYKNLLLCIILMSAIGGVVYIANSVTVALSKNIANQQESNLLNLFFDNFKHIRKQLSSLLLFVTPSLVAIYLSDVIVSKNISTSFGLFLNNEAFATAIITIMLTLICIVITAPITSILGTLATKYLKPFEKL